MQSSNLRTLLLIPAVLLAAGCKPKATDPPPRGPAQVSFVAVAPEKVVLTTELPGRTSAYLVAEIRPQVSGLVQKRLFQEGANVKAGDLLYQIDPLPYQPPSIRPRQPWSRRKPR